MKPNPTNLLKSLEISNPIIGFYDTPEKGLFEPFATAEQCIFSCYQDWRQGKSTCLSEQDVGAIECPGAGYWSCNIASVPREHVAHFLAVEEGLKSSHHLMCQWLERRSACTGVLLANSSSIQRSPECFPIRGYTTQQFNLQIEV